ncbi:low molecular weight protein-tyrosine-phosphatase [Malacoplasma iowae]|uniref:low molecular weight protein-tyrosine-phosphatase n=1 Tax=Malacoplasma iowae TaxID=2116 RepID=UPI0038739609|nr:low molecular weight protein-tyrosine-phosphatase [Malacoplasma iowae]
MKITFVCLGNICRSPMAEFICKDLIVNKYKNNNITVDSAGTSGYHDGEYMHQKTANILQKNNINNKPFVSKKITSNLVNESDYVFAMDNSNYQDLISFGVPKEKLFKITDYLKLQKYDEIPDPWYTNNFELTYSLLNEAIDNFLSTILK